MANQADLDFFRPLWRRVTVVVALAIWLAVETFYVGQQMWILIVGGTLAYAVWSFFLNWKDEPPAPPAA